MQLGSNITSTFLQPASAAVHQHDNTLLQRASAIVFQHKYTLLKRAIATALSWKCVFSSLEKIKKLRPNSKTSGYGGGLKLFSIKMDYDGV